MERASTADAVALVGSGRAADVLSSVNQAGAESGTPWVPLAVGADRRTRPDDDAPQAMAFQAADVALFKGCGWAGQLHDGGIVHLSPRIAGTGMARLGLVLDLLPQAQRLALARAGSATKETGR